MTDSEITDIEEELEQDNLTEPIFQYRKDIPLRIDIDRLLLALEQKSEKELEQEMEQGEEKEDEEENEEQEEKEEKKEEEKDKKEKEKSKEKTTDKEEQAKEEIPETKDAGTTHESNSIYGTSDPRMSTAEIRQLFAQLLVTSETANVKADTKKVNIFDNITTERERGEYAFSRPKPKDEGEAKIGGNRIGGLRDGESYLDGIGVETDKKSQFERFKREQAEIARRRARNAKMRSTTEPGHEDTKSSLQENDLKNESYTTLSREKSDTVSRQTETVPNAEKQGDTETKYESTDRHSFEELSHERFEPKQSQIESQEQSEFEQKRSSRFERQETNIEDESVSHDREKPGSSSDINENRNEETFEQTEKREKEFDQSDESKHGYVKDHAGNSDVSETDHVSDKDHEGKSETSKTDALSDKNKDKETGNRSDRQKTDSKESPVSGPKDQSENERSSFESKRRSRFETESDKKSDHIETDKDRPDANRREEIKSKQEELKKHQMAEGESLLKIKTVPFNAIPVVASASIASVKSKKSKSLFEEEEDEGIVQKKKDERVDTKGKQEEEETKRRPAEIRRADRTRRQENISRIDPATSLRIFREQQAMQMARRKRSRMETIRTNDELQKASALAYEQAETEKGVYADQKRKQDEYEYLNRIGKQKSEEPFVHPQSNRGENRVENFVSEDADRIRTGKGIRSKAGAVGMSAGVAAGIAGVAEDMAGTVGSGSNHAVFKKNQENIELRRENVKKQQRAEQEAIRETEQIQNEQTLKKLEEERIQVETRNQEEQLKEAQRYENYQSSSHYGSEQQGQSSHQTSTIYDSDSNENPYETYGKQNESNYQEQIREERKVKEQLRGEEEHREHTGRESRIRQENTIRQNETERESIRQETKIRRFESEISDREKMMQNEDVLQEAKGKYFVREGSDVKLTYGNQMTEAKSAAAFGSSSQVFKNAQEEKERRKLQQKKYEEEQRNQATGESIRLEESRHNEEVRQQEEVRQREEISQQEIRQREQSDSTLKTEQQNLEQRQRFEQEKIENEQRIHDRYHDINAAAHPESGNVHGGGQIVSEQAAMQGVSEHMETRQEEVERLKTREQAERERIKANEQVRTEQREAEVISANERIRTQTQDERIRTEQEVRTREFDERIRMEQDSERIRTREDIEMDRMRSHGKTMEAEAMAIRSGDVYRREKEKQAANRKRQKEAEKQLRQTEIQNEQETLRTTQEQKERTELEQANERATESRKQESLKQEQEAIRQEQDRNNRQEQEIQNKQDQEQREKEQEQQNQEEIRQTEERRQNERETERITGEEKEKLEKEKLANEQAMQQAEQEKSEIAEKEIRQTVYDEKEKEAIELRHAEEDKASVDQQAERDKHFTSRHQDEKRNTTGYNVGKSEKGKAQGAYTVDSGGDLDKGFSETAMKDGTGFAGMATGSIAGGLASGMSGAELSGFFSGNRKKDKEKEKDKKKKSAFGNGMDDITTTAIAGVTGGASMLSTGGLDGISNISERHINQTIKEATNRYKEDYREKDDEKDPYNEKTEEDELLERALNPFRKHVDESKINTKIDDFISHNIHGAMKSKTKNMKIVSSIAMAAIPGAGAAAALKGSAGAGAGAAKGAAGNNNFYDRVEVEDEPDMLSEEGGLRESKASKERRKQNKLKNQKGIKTFKITGTVLALFLGASLLMTSMVNHDTNFGTAPAMSTVFYDSTKSNTDKMTQAANGVLKSRLESIKNRVLYGVNNSTATSLANDNAVLESLNPWQGPKYNLTPQQIEDLAYACTAENGTELGVMCEINQMLNLYELFKQDSYSSVWEMVANCSWYKGTTGEALRYHNSDTPTPTMIETVRKAVNDGYRQLPPYCDEHDDKGDLLPYDEPPVRGVTIITQDPNRFKGGGSSWTFYVKPDNIADPFGYSKEGMQRAIAMGWRDELTAKEGATGPNTYDPKNRPGGQYNSDGSVSYNGQSLNSGIVFTTASRAGTTSGTTDKTTNSTTALGNERNTGMSTYFNNTPATLTTDVFVQAVANTMQWARVNKVTYGCSVSTTRPCDDGLISCDRMVARALWDLGFTDQPMPPDDPCAGVTCGNIGEYLKSHGWIESFNAQDITYGSVVNVKHENDKDWGHTFVALSFNPDTYVTDRYDAGCDEFIQREQPIRGLGWGYRKDSVAVYNLPLNGVNTSLDPNNPGDGYDGSKNLPVIPCTKAILVDEDGNEIDEIEGIHLNKLDEEHLKEITENGAMNLKYDHEYTSETVMEKRRYLEAITYKDGEYAPYTYHWVDTSTTDPETGVTTPSGYYERDPDTIDIYYKGGIEDQEHRRREIEYSYGSAGNEASGEQDFKMVRGEIWGNNLHLPNTIYDYENLRKYAEKSKNEPYKAISKDSPSVLNVLADMDTKVVTLGDPDWYRYSKRPKQDKLSMTEYTTRDGLEEVTRHTSHTEPAEVLNPTLTMVYLSKQRDVVGNVQNWPKEYDEEYRKLVAGTYRFNDDDMYKRALFNILTVGTFNVDPRDNKGMMQGLINRGQINLDDAKFVKLDEEAEKERVEQVMEGLNQSDDDAESVPATFHDEKDKDKKKEKNDPGEGFSEPRFPDSTSDYSAKMGYLEYACDIMDASFEAVDLKGFEVEYKVIVDRTQNVSWTDGDGTAYSDYKLKLEPHVYLYVTANIDDIIEYVQRVDGHDWYTDDKEKLYEYFAPEFDYFQERYALSDLVLAGSSSRLSPGDGGKLPDVAKLIYVYLYRKGLDDYCISGILGNMAQETGGGKLEDIKADFEETKKSGHKGYGLIQWTGKRRKALEKYALERGMPVSNIYLQLDFLWLELFVNKTNWSKDATLERFMISGSPTDAAKNFCAGTELNGTIEEAMKWEDGHLPDVRIPEAERAYKLIMSNNNFNLLGGMGAFAGGVDENGMLRVPYINQGNGLYENGNWTHTDWPEAKFKLNGHTIHQAGCGTCSTAMGLSYVLGRLISPLEFMDNGQYTGNGSADTVGSVTAQSYGVPTYRTQSIQEAMQALRSGYPVMAHVGASVFTSGGHYILLVGVSPQGKIGVNDPGHCDNTYWYNGITFDPSTVDNAVSLKRSEGNDDYGYTVFGISGIDQATGTVQGSMLSNASNYTPAAGNRNSYATGELLGQAQLSGYTVESSDDLTHKTCMISKKLAKKWKLRVNDFIKISTTNETYKIVRYNDKKEDWISICVNTNELLNKEYTQIADVYSVTGTPGLGGATASVNGYSQRDLELIWAIVAQEDDKSYEGAYAVISTALNRANQNFDGYGRDVLSQLTAKDQFCYSPSVSDPIYYQRRLGGNVYDYVKQAVHDCLTTGKPSHPYLYFRSTSGPGRTQIGPGGNWYF